MKLSILVFSTILVFVPCHAQPTEKPGNPLLGERNALLRFSDVKAEHVKAASDLALAQLREAMAAIYNVKQPSFANTLGAFDSAVARFNDVFSPVYLLANTAVDEGVREVCHQAIDSMQSSLIALDLDEQLYTVVKAFAETDEAKGLSGAHKRFLERTLSDFRKNGLALSAEKRQQLVQLRNEIAPLEQAFDRNIAENNDALIVDEAGMEGLGEDYKKAHRQPDGTYRIDMSYPSYGEFMRDAKNGSKREALFKLYNNRAADSNLKILGQVLGLRKKLAQLIGFENYADYQLSAKLAKSSARVFEFENGLVTSLMPKAKLEYARLLEAKRKQEGADASAVYAWEYSFYLESIMRDAYQFDQKEVSQYFESNAVLEGLFRITQTLMGVTFHKLSDASVWHPDVSLYEVREGERKVGYFYLDLYPRANKYNHAACFPIIQGRRQDGIAVLPVAALVCNFGQPKDGVPALMNMGEVETIFHEFGHVLHHVLSEAELSLQSGTNVDGDFAEAPSQIFENWARNYEGLKLFARHYQTGAVIPEDLFNRIAAARTAFTGIANLRQVFLGLLDMAYHTSYDPKGAESLDQVLQRIEAQTTVFPNTPDTHFQAGFGHLMGYGANYYGYLYSLVFAYDMFSAFEKEGVLNPETGRRYRNEILAKGSTDDALELMRHFLGREPNNEAFTRSLAIP